jgi:hypothetical protein
VLSLDEMASLASIAGAGASAAKPLQ